MSRMHEYAYQLEAARRREIFNERARATAERLYQQSLKAYREMESRGYEAYIPEEMARLKLDLSRLQELLVSDPAGARELSYEVNSNQRSMSVLAAAAVKEFEYTEQLRVERAVQEKREHQHALIGLYFTLLQEIKNPIIANFSAFELQELKAAIESGQVQSEQDVRACVAEIISKAEFRAGEWKRTELQNSRKRNVEDKLTEAEQQLRKETIEDQEKAEGFLKKIEMLRDTLNSEEADCEDVEKQICQLETEVDDTLITEEVRRETVKAIIKQLRSQEFTVERPQIIQSDNKNYVKLVAKKPSGKRAVCSIDLHGTIAYRFDNYEGMACLKDIEKFHVDLEQIYSVKLSDERILWSNPDRLSKETRSIPGNDGRHA